MSLRVRFAPSPTGALHVGGARAALYNWLLARGASGALVLRIEDTDRERSTPENVEQILDSLRWLGLDWDEGPIFQSANAERHAAALEQLLDSGAAYRSTATAQDVQAYKREHGGDRGFRGGAGEGGSQGAVRLRVPDDGATVVHDLIRGDTTFANVHLDDPVIARADGSALYNFAVAVDDLDAAITHVVRGEDHLSNTPKQLLVFEALGVPAPRYAHLPLLHGPDGRKLSKRHGAASVGELRDAGFLPEAVRNYLALLGWGHEDETLMSSDQMQEHFRLEDVSKNPSIFDEQKLRWMNGRYIRALPVDELAERLEAFTGRDGLHEAAAATQEKIQALADFWPLVGFVFDGAADDPVAREKVMRADGAAELLVKARKAIATVEPFDAASVERALFEIVASEDVKPKAVFQPVRVALAGTTVSPGIGETVALVGRDEALARIDAALAGR